MIADIDETTSIEPSHPSTALIIEIDEELMRVVVPDSVLADRRELLCVDRPVAVTGEMIETPHGVHHVATTLRLVATGH
jgi:hypothetical protein